MNCRDAIEQLGAHLDGELPQEQRQPLEEHLAACMSCAAELEELRALVSRLGHSDHFADTGWRPGPHDTGKTAPDLEKSHLRLRPAVAAPADLWPAIQRRLDGGPAKSRRYRLGRQGFLMRLLHRPLAAAASLALLLGGGAFMVVLLTSPAVRVAQAGFVDYSVLLDGVSADVDAAVARFLRHYGAERVDVAAAHDFAPGLRFNMPAELPGGFMLQDAYRLRFGDMPGVAASYRRGDEPLFVFFHPPVNREVLGVHRESHCDVAGRQGYRVEVGPWHLLHFTDPTTCHCLLSRLQDESELRDVLAAVSPEFVTFTGHNGLLGR